MGKNRPIVVATLGYIIGTIWGLYFKINIVLIYALLLIITIVANQFKTNKYKGKFKFISIKKILRYIKLILDFKSIIIIIIFSTISNFIVIQLNSKYENLYSNIEAVTVTGKIVNNGTYKEYKTTYKLKVEKVNGKNQFKGTNLYIDVNKNIKENLKYGDYINVQGIYQNPSQASNYGGFDYTKYLRQEQVYRNFKSRKYPCFKRKFEQYFIYTLE